MSVLVCVALLLAGAAGEAWAGDPFGAFIKALRPTCARAPSADCASAVAAYLDTNGNGRVEFGELQRALAQAGRSVGDKGSALNGIERNLTVVALMAVRYAGAAEVFANFDANRDGSLSTAELFADFRIDRRPFGQIVKDPKAVDWKRFAGRFGKVGFLITDLLPPSHRR
ncbi:MAG: hypothetical protein OEO83_02245 [Alphaproteobacteria bacterium]|nr:hypothetical protein [Alphaproteobacteria bacterium]